jgi:hypothetical protein
MDRTRDNRIDKRRLSNRQRDHTLAQQQQGASTHMPTNLWQPGQSGNPAGRMRGSRNKLSEEVICALLRDFREHGQKAIAKVRRTQPAAYLKVLALLVPREHKVEYSNSLKNWTDEELEAGIDLVKQMLESRAVASGAVIEGTAKTIALLPPAALERPQRKPVDTAIGPQERKPRKRVPSPAST